MRIGTIVQARTGSSRLPRKVLMKIEGLSLLEHIINRLKRAKSLDEIVIATSDKKEDDKIIKIAQRCGVKSFRGSENDVLDRYFKAAKKFNVDMIVRVCADSPMVEPHFIDLMVKHHIKSNADLTINYDHEKGLPDGTGAETITFPALERSHKLAKNPFFREHVDEYILQHPADFRIEKFEVSSSYVRPRMSLEINTKEQFELVRGIYSQLYRREEIIDLKDVIGLYDKNPQKFESVYLDIK